MSGIKRKPTSRTSGLAVISESSTSQGGPQNKQPSLVRASTNKLAAMFEPVNEAGLKITHV